MGLQESNAEDGRGSWDDMAQAAMLHQKAMPYEGAKSVLGIANRLRTARWCVVNWWEYISGPQMERVLGTVPPSHCHANVSTLAMSLSTRSPKSSQGPGSTANTAAEMSHTYTRLDHVHLVFLSIVAAALGILTLSWLADLQSGSGRSDVPTSLRAKYVRCSLQVRYRYDTSGMQADPGVTLQATHSSSRMSPSRIWYLSEDADTVMRSDKR